MKKKLYVLLACLVLATGQGNAQRFRQVIISFAVRLPNAYPASLPKPDPINLGSLKPSDLPRYDSLANAYQKIIDQLKTQAPSIKRDTMMMGYLHDQIVVRSFKRMIPSGTNDPKNIPTIIALSRQLGNLALQTKNQYYIWAGNIWEENALRATGNIIKSFEVAFKRAKLCDDCPECHQAPECYTALAQYYAEFNDTTNTDLYFEKALNSVSKIQEKVYTLREWAVVYNKQRKPQKALEIIKRLNQLDKKPFDESWILTQKALSQVQLNQFDEALETTQLAISKKTDEFKLRGILDPNMADVYIREGFRALFAAIYLGKNEPQKALEYANSPYYMDDLGDPQDLIMYRIYKALGKDKLALQHHEFYLDYLKSFQNDDSKNQLAILQRNYEVQKVQNIADYEKLRADNLIKNRIYLVFGLMLLSVLLLLIYRNNLQKQKANALLKAQKEEIDLQREKAEKALSALKVTQAQLIQSEKLASLADLTAGVAHEIQNPLNFVNNFSELSVELVDELKEEINRTEIDKEFVGELISDLTQNQERINHHGKRAASIVKGMLEHSRSSTGIPTLSDLNTLADEYQRMAFHSYCAKDNDFKVTLETHFDSSLPKIEVIPQDIGRVLLNLINNAFYAVAERSRNTANEIEAFEPTVRVTTKRLENTIEIRVQDNGNGIPESIKDKIFQPFFTTKPTGQGTGLGLSLAYDIVTKGHGGYLEVETKENEGTEFTIILPVKNPINSNRSMKNLLLFTGLFYSIIISGQTSRTDSLFSLLSKAKEDEVRVNLLAELSGEFVSSNPDSVFLLASKGLKIAQAIGYFEGEIRCKDNLAGYWWTVGDYATAVKLLLQVLAFYKSQNNPIVAKVYSGLLNSYRDQGDYKEALYYSSLTLENIPPKFEFTRGIANAMRGSIYYEMNNLDSAQFYLTKALNYPLVLSKGWILLMNGRLYAKLKKTDTAFSYYRQAIEVLRADKNYKALAGAFISTGELYEQTGKIDSAINYGKQGLDLAQKKKFNKETIQSYLLLSRAYEKVNTEAALQYYKLAIVGKDSLFNQEKQKQLLSYKFNEELRQSEIKNAQQQSMNKNRVLILLILLTCFVLFILILVRNNRHKQTANLLLHQQKEEIQSTLSQLRSTQAQLIQSEKLASLGELTAGIAHEIQNPLNFVNNFAEVSTEMLGEMKEEIKAGNTSEVIAIADDLEQNLSKINHHGQRASAIVKGMLEHSRVSTGVKTPTDLNALADEFLRLAYHGLRAKDNNFNATIETHFDPDLPLVSVIPQDIGRVLLNLINNAFYAVAECSRSTEQQRASVGVTSSHADTMYQPTVTISTQKTGDHIIIKVEDNGPGIPESIRDKIFQPFFTTKPTGQGTGLGLSLAYDIVTKGHGGSLNVDSTEGEGTKFTISLPTLS